MWPTSRLIPILRAKGDKLKFIPECKGIPFYEQKQSKLFLQNEVQIYNTVY